MPVTLSPAGAEITVRNALRSLLASLQSVIDWTEEAVEADRLARITWPDYRGTALPAFTISLGNSNRRSEAGEADGGITLGGGTIALLFFDAIDPNISVQADDDRFGGNLTAVVDELCRAAYSSGFHLSRVDIPQTGWNRTSINTEDEEDESGGPPSSQLWVGKVFLQWGFVG